MISLGRRMEYERVRKRGREGGEGRTTVHVHLTSQICSAKEGGREGGGERTIVQVCLTSQMCSARWRTGTGSP